MDGNDGREDGRVYQNQLLAVVVWVTCRDSSLTLTTTAMRLTRSQQTTEVDSRISTHATHHRVDDLDSRTAEERDLLPAERVRLHEDNVDISTFVTTICAAFERISRQKNVPKTVFRVGDTVEIRSSTKLPIIAAIVSVHEISPKNSMEADEDLEDFEVSPLKAVVHRFELAGRTRVNRNMRLHVEVCQ